MRLRAIPVLVVAAVAGLFVQALFTKPSKTQAMPVFAQAYGVRCSTCHTMVPLLNAYGRYVQRTGYSSLDRKVLARALPVWLDDSVLYNSTAGAGTGAQRYDFGNVALHGVGYLAPDVTFHAQQWFVQNNASGPLDTLWITYNNLLHRDGHLFVGKLIVPAPSPYSFDFELDTPAASSTLVGEHDWGGTYNNRWGTKLVYAHKSIDVEAAYVLSGEDLNGITDFNRPYANGDPGDKTFLWKVAFARPTNPLEVGVFGSNGSVPVTTGLDIYSSISAYVQIDPAKNGRPGLLAIYQRQRDANPGMDSNRIDPASGNPDFVMPATSSHGVSLGVYEPFLRNSIILGLRHDQNDNGFGTSSNGNVINLGLSFPHFQFAHVYFESALGATSSTSPGPTWKGLFWLTLPFTPVK